MPEYPRLLRIWVLVNRHLLYVLLGVRQDLHLEKFGREVGYPNKKRRRKASGIAKSQVGQNRWKVDKKIGKVPNVVFNSGCRFSYQAGSQRDI